MHLFTVTVCTFVFCTENNCKFTPKPLATVKKIMLTSIIVLGRSHALFMVLYAYILLSLSCGTVHVFAQRAQ